MSKTTSLAFLIIIFIISLIFIKKTTNNTQYIKLKEDSVILAFGDSLTNGFGAKSGFSYPEVMKQRGFNVIKEGINGEVSSEGLGRLPQLLLKYKPDLVILCHGGNDIIQRVPAQKLKQNLLEMIRLIKESGSEVLLVGVPNFSIFGFTTHEVYEEIANETDILFEGEVLTQIQQDNSLKSDYVHPNESGYEKMADKFIEKIRD